ncbi:MAG: DUF2235 domain-containing protein [Pseudomonadota bacterium]|nr:DUF2235 domain-containing protein [Pseudomonadota bacterium]
MADSARNLIVLSDGTGNSAAKQNKTNVWRLYQAIDLTDGTQLAVFGDGVGTSSVKVLRVLGLALGVGVKRNVLNLYKFLCRNYNADDHTDDRIWAFGFSRGAFTIRVLLGLIYHEGLVAFESEEELNRNARAAYRAYRKKAFPAYHREKAPPLPLVAAGRVLRDLLISAWNGIIGARSYPDWKVMTNVMTGARSPEPTVRGKKTIKEEMLKLKHEPSNVNVHFVGLWDTVAAYGLPIDELTTAVDKWVWPMKFRREVVSLLPNVQHARHALSLDDERKTFHPTPWDETKENDLVAKREVMPDRLRQVWFAGTHADVGGGYPDDGLSYVPLGWMIDEAAEKGLRFVPLVVEAFAALATPTGRIYDSRSGFGALYRYQPRDAQQLLGPGNTPLVYGSVITRMVCGNDGYAPISLPEEIEVLPPYWPPDWPPVAFKDAAAVTQALAQANQDAKPLSRDSDVEQQRRVEQQLHVLRDTQLLARKVSAQAKRKQFFDLVLYTVWWRRIVYFVSLALVVIAVAFPLLAQYLRVEGTEDLNDRAGGSVGWTLGLIKGFLPGFAETWVAAVVRNSAGAALIIVGLLVSLRFSAVLQQRIRDRARAAWNVDTRAVDRLAPTGQRQALARATLFFIAFAIGTLALSNPPWAISHAPPFFWFSALGAIVFGLWWAFRRFRPAGRVNPEEPGFFLGIARIMQTNKWTVCGYKFLAQKFVPGGFLVLSAILAVFLTHRAGFDLLSTGGEYCKATPEVKAKSTQKMEAIQNVEAIQKVDQTTENDILGEGKKFETSSMCNPTGLRLIAGRKYRIRLDMDEEWFDKGIRTDVAGFTADSMRHYMALPLKRWWWENWFQPIARIGEIGNYEHVLQPAAPLPVVHFEGCRPKEEKRLSGWDAIKNTPSPAAAEFKTAQLECEPGKGIRPNRVLISDITADATGELFLYVNDAVLTLPGLTDVFYKNNSGTAKVTVTRILADVVE